MANIACLHNSIFIDGQSSDFPTLFFEKFDGAPSRRMFNCGRDDVAAMRSICFADSANCEVVRFGATGREDNLVWTGANERGNLSPRFVNGRARFLTEGMHA